MQEQEEGTARMTPRERVTETLSHRKADRIPRYDILRDGYAKNWRRALHKDENADPYDYYSKIDIGRIVGRPGGPFPTKEHIEETGGDSYLMRDSWGRLTRRSHTGVFFEVLETAIKEKSDLDTLEFEDPWNPAKIAAVRQEEREIHDRFCPVTGVLGPFMPSYFLRGELQLFIDLKDDEAFCRALAERLADYLMIAGEKALRYTNTYDTALWIYDELASSKAPLFSPDTFERIYLEPYKRMISYWKSLGVKNLILHCDGNCVPLFDLLIEAGISGVQGAHPNTGNTIPAMKAKYGKKLSFITGMCNVSVLNKGTRKQIADQVASVMEVAKDGGVIIGSHSIDDDIPVENYDYYCSVLEKYDESW